MIHSLLIKALCMSVHLAAVASLSLRPEVARADGAINFPIVRGASSLSQKRDANVFSAAAINNEWNYGIEIEIGTPPQRTFVEIDTGSDTLWVNADCTTAPAELGQNDTCVQIPKYDPSQSSTAQNLSVSALIGYGDGTIGAYLGYYTDFVTIGGINLTSQNFGVASETLGMVSGIMGIAPPITGFAINQTFPRVLDSMFTQGFINKRVYGIGLGSSDASEGSLTFGGLDTGKFSGDLQELPIIKGVFNRTRLTVDYNGVSLTLPGQSAKSYTINDTNVQLDSGTTFIQLEESMANQIFQDLNAEETVIDESTTYSLVDCSMRDWTGGLTFTFKDKPITISFGDLIFTAEGQCAVGIQPWPVGQQQILGLPFFRAAYAVFDFDSQTAYLAPAANCTSKTMAITQDQDIANITGSCSDATSGPSTSATPTSSGTGLVHSFASLAACGAIGMLFMLL
ncbi:aspartic peptidase domain-containing protein [Pestalotiopsis sp. NC0098]|nr:aspartic peptidase domain-containing protein [Pestalotiopsis sp. NC0098]